MKNARISPRHPAFSPRRIGAIASITLTELTRQKAFYFILFFALLLIGSSAFLVRFTFQQEFQVLKDISLGAISIFSSLLAIAATARLLPQEIEDRTVYTVLAKPVPRFEYVTGKLLGVLVLLAIGTIVMAVLFFTVLYLREQSALAETAQQMAGTPPQQLAEALDAIRTTAASGNLMPAIAIIYLKACLLAALTLFVSSFATSNLFTILVTVFIYLIGHLQSTAREYWLQEQGGEWWSRIFLATVALIFPDLQLFNLADAAAAGASIPSALFFKIAGLGCFYILLYLLLAAAVFGGKEL